MVMISIVHYIRGRFLRSSYAINMRFCAQAFTDDFCNQSLFVNDDCKGQKANDHQAYQYPVNSGHSDDVMMLVTSNCGGDLVPCQKIHIFG